jgi:preprotein translocase subunit SecE
MGSLSTYFSQVWQELHKVSWPSRQQTTDKTLLVIIVSLVIAIYLGVIDSAFEWIMTTLINL